MDWLYAVAKKKAASQLGGSRSLIESLNQINEVAHKHHMRVNTTLERTDDVFESILHRKKEIESTNALISPEKTKTLTQAPQGGHRLTQTPNNKIHRISRTPDYSISRVSVYSKNSLTPRSIMGGHDKLEQVKMNDNDAVGVSGIRVSDPNSSIEINKLTVTPTTINQTQRHSPVIEGRNQDGWSPYQSQTSFRVSPPKRNEHNIELIKSPMIVKNTEAHNSSEKNLNVKDHSITPFNNMNDATRGPESAYRITKDDKEVSANESTGKTYNMVGHVQNIMIDDDVTDNATKIGNYDTLTTEKRTRRKRSTMFKPLPNKDPLVVSSVLAPLHDNQYAQHVTITTNLDRQIEGNSRLNTIKKKTKAENGSSQSERHFKRVTQSPVFRSIESTSNVFDRLSSHPTKSFENKMSSRRGLSNSYGTRKYTSSADLSGSPNHRSTINNHKSFAPIKTPIRTGVEPNLRLGSTSNSKENSDGIAHTTKSEMKPSSVQETLKSIFTNNSPINNYGGRKQAYRSPMKNSPNKPRFRKSLIPRLNHSVSSKKSSESMKLDEPKSSVDDLKCASSKQSIKSTGAIYDLSPLNANPSEQFEGVEQQQEENHPIKESTEESSSKFSDQTLHNTKDWEKRSQSSYDSLTSVHLLSHVGSEKSELKKKLNKRLSEVMRSQQEHQRRKLEQQKRMSQLEEGIKKRNKSISDPRNTFFERQSINKRGHIRKPDFVHMATNRSFNSQNILSTINTADHRIIAGGSDDNSVEPTPKTEDIILHDQSLPEIFSDSDAENTSTLASWAKSPQLEEQLLNQQGTDPKLIFGPIPPPYTEETFKNARLHKYVKRGV